MAGSAEFDALIERYHDALGSIINGNPDGLMPTPRFGLARRKP